MSNHQNMPTTYSLQEVKEHSIQEENDQMSFAVREAEEQEELEMIAEVVNAGGAKKRQKESKVKNTMKEKRQALSKIYQQKNPGNELGADAVREERNRSNVGMSSAGQFHNNGGNR